MTNTAPGPSRRHLPLRRRLTGVGANVQLDTFQASPSFMGRAANGGPTAPSAVGAGAVLAFYFENSFQRDHLQRIAGAYRYVATEPWTDTAHC